MSTKPLVYVLDPYHPDAISLLQCTPTISVTLPSSPLTKSKTWHQDAVAILVRSETHLTSSDFTRAPNLKVIVKQGVGVDNIDLKAAAAHGIAVHNTPALNSEAVAELALALPLSLARRVSEIDRRVRKGEAVVRSQVLGVSLFRKTVGVVGMGNIGREVARKWRGACESRVLAYDPVAGEGVWEGQGIEHVRVGSLEEVLREADVVTLHVPLLESTRGMIGERELGLMKREAILVNCARGGIVDEEALARALKEERILGACLDALEIEPPNKETHKALLESERVVLMPHVGASTRENQSRSGVAVVETLLAVLRGDKDAPGKVV
ncbi:putative D-3-phosphoglycerate dehydrogenase [Rhexocercosporidium sp. MPI-PUGE-AT-0058]|nr:putative D-3-phosphoglycerate dehydrogenase [Rhexocercosporidium sp. MPI-PUGE-AT-0058]